MWTKYPFKKAVKVIDAEKGGTEVSATERHYQAHCQDLHWA
jgi:hypothetical protein